MLFDMQVYYQQEREGRGKESIDLGGSFLEIIEAASNTPLVLFLRVTLGLKSRFTVNNKKGKKEENIAWII